VFWDESGVSLLPEICRTWAPRGCTPVVRHHAKWKRASMAAALCYGTSGGGVQLAFHHQHDAYDTDTLIGALQGLRTFLGGYLAPTACGGSPLGHVQKARYQRVVGMVGALHVADGEAVPGPVHHLGGVVGADRARLEDAQVGAGAGGGREAAGEAGVAHADAEPAAGDARLGDLQQRRPDAPALTDDGAGNRQPADGEVLAEGARCQRAPDLAGPPVEVLTGVGVDRLVRAAAGGTVRTRRDKVVCAT